jgi:cytoskeletal protein CcmA (bactofilin family)
MREERGHLRGNLVIDEPYTLWGSIAGDVTAVKGSKFYVRGPIYGSLTVLHGGRVHVFGNVTGDLVVKDGAKVIHSGVVGGDVVNQGGRLYVDRIAKTLGEIRTEDDGQTTIETENPQRPEVD